MIEIRHKLQLQCKNIPLATKKNSTPKEPPSHVNIFKKILVS